VQRIELRLVLQVVPLDGGVETENHERHRKRVPSQVHGLTLRAREKKEQAAKAREENQQEGGKQ
jgi:hypothetical protein